MARGSDRFGWVLAAFVLSIGSLASATAEAQRSYTIPAYQVGTVCTSGNATACYELGLRQYWGDEMPADRFAAYRSWQLACAGNDLQSCWEVAYAYQAGEFLPANPQMGFQMYVQNCARGHATSCNSVGFAFETGQGAPIDLASAFQYYTVACGLSDAWGCRNQGIYLRDGRPGVVASDPVRGIQLLTRACELNLPQACTEAAQGPQPLGLPPQMGVPQPIPQQCGMPVASYGPLQIGSAVTLGFHTPWNGDANWTPEMGRFVGIRTTITSLEGIDGVGCPIVRVLADGGQYYWRIRNMMP